MSKSTKTRVLVTGATGFLGSNILKAMNENPAIECIAACRDSSRLTKDFTGTVREGDLLDDHYRRQVVEDIDAICHAGTWASMWGHKKLERERFFDPAISLMEHAIAVGVGRFIMAGTVVIGEVSSKGEPHDDFSETRHTGFWPHLDCLVDIDRHMQANCTRGMQMTLMRLGHFIGPGNRLGLVPALVPRLKTYLVPWLGGGKKRLPLVAGRDLGKAFELAVVAENLDPYESFNITGSEFPSLREVVGYIAEKAGTPKPLYSVPYPAGYAFGYLMETINRLLPGSSPFLTRSIVHLCEDWECPSSYANQKIGYLPEKNWRDAIDEHLDDLRQSGDAWLPLRQT
ncbi:MAG TPA: NAD(P)-dependent oxidoreductase [Gammaproteobacteria bacterium]|nr:NAD(P)-dependent oxidoreductase [Gammaproteobacteria bacterium]